MPTREGERRAALALRGVLLGEVDHVDHAVRRDEPTKCSSELKAPLPNSPSRPISRITVGRKASSELKATCWREAHAVVRQELLPARLKASATRARRAGAGSRGRAPPVSVAVDKGERAEACLRPVLPAAAHQEPHGRPDPAGHDEAGPERRRPRRAAAWPSASRSRPFRRAGPRPRRQALALGLDVAADLLRRAPVMVAIAASAPRSSAWPPRSPAQARAACLS